MDGADAQTSRRLEFEGIGGVKLVAESWGDPANPGVLLAHGGGQTRHAWGGTAAALAARGWHALTLDQRGHGGSDWSQEGDYRGETLARALIKVAADAFAKPPVLVGASMGGMAGIGAQALSGGTAFAAIVLVDITPKMNVEGVQRIVAFMREKMEDGFANLEEAAEAVAGYLPHRPRKRDLSGLEKNLRKRPDGRLRWHWDPRFLDAPTNAYRETEAEVEAAARTVKIPTLLVRGRMSDIVTEDEIEHFLEVMPHASYVDVSDAAHMVAGDKNDAFTDAVVDFLKGLGR